MTLLYLAQAQWKNISLPPMVQDNNNLIVELNNTLAIELPEKISFEDMHSKLAAHINQLIKDNFEDLVRLLYKIDINEDKLKLQLVHNPTENAGNMIATLIIERLQQKAAFKKQFSKKPSSSDNEEKW